MNKSETFITFERSIDPQLVESLKEKSNILYDSPTLLEVQARFNKTIEASVKNTQYSTEVSIADWMVPATTVSEAVSVRVYKPKLKKHDKPLPVLLWVHGGGFISGNVESDDAMCERFAVECNCAVVSVEYRLAPQHPYPAGFDDWYAALQWLACNGTSKLNLDLNNLAVGGASAGGCLAAGVVLKAVEQGGPKIKHQVLLVPALDDRHETPSSIDITDYRVCWNREMSLLAWDGYLKNITGETPSYAAPAQTKTIPNLPKTFISVEERDVLRDEAIIYAQRLMQAGVSTELHVYPGTFHGSFEKIPNAEIIKQHMSDVLKSLNKSFRNNEFGKSDDD